MPVSSTRFCLSRGTNVDCFPLSRRHDDLISHAAEGDWSGIAPLRILSFDIECAGRKGIFPEAEIDPVIQIANMVTRQGEAASASGPLGRVCRIYTRGEVLTCGNLSWDFSLTGDSKPFIRNIFTLNTCAHIVGSEVLEFTREQELLSKWRAFVEEVDPDVIIGYNTSQFDIPYLMDRAKALKVTDFPFFSRLKGSLSHSSPVAAFAELTRSACAGSKTEVKETHFSSKAYGTRDSKETVMDGRLQLDILQVMQRDYKLRSYTLNSVCAHFLGTSQSSAADVCIRPELMRASRLAGEQKEDVHHSVITDLQNGNAESRRRLAVYCLKVRHCNPCLSSSASPLTSTCSDGRTRTSRRD